MNHSELQESPESRLLGAGFSRQLEMWVTPDGQRALSTGDAIAALDDGEIGHVTFPFAANVRALPDELVDRICHPPAPSPPAWLDSLAGGREAKAGHPLGGPGGAQGEIVTERQATLAHEAAHVVGGLLAGHRVKAVRLGKTRQNPDSAARTTFDFSGSPDVDVFAHLVATLMGPLAEGRKPAPWPPAPDPHDSDSMAVSRLINHLGLGKGAYQAAIAIAAHHLDDPQVKAAMAAVAHALSREGVLTDATIRKALGPQLAWFDRAERQAA